ncbi:receptor-like protein 7 [Vicia villosa]|uniref:receptor-like protein 7 n=1 Tax=Vicia villosa TaxID=3911 RepID=UPI00273BA115|nr:receptor-like protein 7 [Vicia villosa]
MVSVWSLVLSVQFLFLYSLFSFTFTTSFPLTHPKCHQKESHALLQFKEGLIISKSASSDNPLSYPKTTSWNASTDCCSWEGIQCDEHTNHVIHIDLRSSQLYGTMDANTTLFRLVHLRSLDLSDNDFNYSQIPPKIGELSQLRYLNLSHAIFSGEIPPQVSQLSKLLYLDLSYHDAPNRGFSLVNVLLLKQSYLRNIIQNSTKLEILRLSYVTISSPLPNTITNLSSLQELHLFNSELYGEFPVGVFHLPNLKILDLRLNPNLIGRLPEFQSSSLTKLGLAYTGFYGTLPESIGKLSSLNILIIYGCQFSGYIPSSFGNLTQLIEIDLQFNKLKGDPSASLSNLTKLENLYVGHNEFTFETISWIGKLSSLIVLEISSLNIGSDIPLSFANLTQLEILIAENSNITGEIPFCMINLTNLVVLSLPHNFLSGKLELNMFLKLKNLLVLDLSFNKLSLYSGKSLSHMTDFGIQILILDSCNLVEVPKFIRYSNNLEILGLSNNNITSLPNWLWRKSSLQIIYVSDNSLAGEISPSICNLKSLIQLELAFNSLSGNVPSCIVNFSPYLEILDLKGNKLSGLIPQTYQKENIIQMIDFRNNNLQGQLPRALVNCGRLEYFDISHNNINDSFPFWLGNLPELKVLALSDNEFHGDIRCPDNMTCTFPKLHIIDLSHNEFSGSFPSKMISTWKTMQTSNTSQLLYEKTSKFYSPIKEGEYLMTSNISYSFTMSNKGITMVYCKLQKFYSLIAIDISSNKITGEIPNIIGDLKGLVLLNLSNNNFVGSIPSSLGKLSKLETLDLSFNSLSGKIPQQLTQLTFLEFFNVSYNNLTGPIPQNAQFSTFQGNSFEGNQGLCGDQLSKKCIEHPGPSSSDDDNDSESLFEIGWKVSLIGYAGGLVAGVALGMTYASQPKCHQYESHALLQFKEGFNINKTISDNPLSYPKTTSWNASTDCCSWDGIQCDEHTDHVIHIDLSSSKLYGTLNTNSTLFRLVHLRHLDLSDNDFNYSQIPPKIGELSQLRYLNLSLSVFFGEIPPQFSKLSKLLSLDLSFQTNSEVNPLQLKHSNLRSMIQNSTKLEILRLGDLYGEFPTGVFHLPNLKILNLRFNPNLKGRLPEFQSSSLTVLALDEAGFYGTLPISIGKLSSLNMLLIFGCHFSGYIPSSFGNLTQLMQIDLQYNKLRGDPSASLENLTKLRNLYIGYNDFTFETIAWIEILNAENSNIIGEIPFSMMNLTNLVVLGLSHNFLSGKLELNMFLKLKNLIFLNLSYNKLSLYDGKSLSHMTDFGIQILQLDSCNLVEVPKFVRYSTNLEYLGLSSNSITSLPGWLWRKSSLQFLDVSVNSLTGEISPSICNLKSLIHFELSFNNFSGNVPSCISNFKYFDISHNNINDSFPFWLGNLPELKVLALSDNEFHGNIRCPDNMTCTFPKLHIIDLSHNDFSGRFPSEMILTWKTMKTSNTSQLQYEETSVFSLPYKQGGFSVSENVSYSFTMSNKGILMVYNNLQEFYSLIAIDISSNKINGEIPKIIGDLKGLVLLNLSNNNFVGSIPSSLGKLSNLEALDLSFNRLSGKIPQQLTQLTFLEFFNVSFNNLTGSIPQNAQFSTFQENSFEGNQGLCGDQLSNKCIEHPGPVASDDDHDSESLFEIGWKVSLIGYAGGLVAGVALGSTYASQVLWWLRRFF